MRIIQYTDAQSITRVGIVVDEQTVTALAGEQSVYDLAMNAIEAGQSLEAVVGGQATAGQVSYEALISEGRLLPPLTHPEPSRTLVTGTGLTHLGSAASRDAMHKKAAQEAAENLTDSMKMFNLGLAGGKPAAGEVGVQPEWFYKGDGSWIVAPYQALTSPAFGLDHGEEPEMVGLYVIGPAGQPYRVGFALGNEFSDHVTERQNYLYLAHSKLRQSSYGPELRLGALPTDVRGTSCVMRNGEVIWEKPFISGEDNMSHSIANLEYHHFKYSQFRRPGDVHVHYFGTATLSFADGIVVEPGDEFQISAEDFGRPLRNGVAVEPSSDTAVQAL